MRTLATKQPTHDSAKQNKDGSRVRSACSSASRSRSVSPLSTGMPSLQRKCACGGGCPRCQENLGIQTKLKIGEPGDKYEKEADRIADEVMRMPEPSIQRQVEPEEEEEEMVQRKANISSISPLIQRQDIQDMTKTSEVRPIVNEVLNSPGQPLPQASRTFMEPRFGYDFSGVRIYANADASTLCRSLGARAFTVGENIFFGEGELQTSSDTGRRLLAHELVHTNQQTDQNTPAIQRKIDLENGEHLLNSPNEINLLSLRSDIIYGVFIDMPEKLVNELFLLDVDSRFRLIQQLNEDFTHTNNARTQSYITWGLSLIQRETIPPESEPLGNLETADLGSKTGKSQPDAEQLLTPGLDMAEVSAKASKRSIKKLLKDIENINNQIFEERRGAVDDVLNAFQNHQFLKLVLGKKQSRKILKLLSVGFKTITAKNPTSQIAAQIIPILVNSGRLDIKLPEDNIDIYSIIKEIREKLYDEQIHSSSPIVNNEEIESHLNTLDLSNQASLYEIYVIALDLESLKSDLERTRKTVREKQKGQLTSAIINVIAPGNLVLDIRLKFGLPNNNLKCDVELISAKIEGFETVLSQYSMKKIPLNALVMPWTVRDHTFSGIETALFIHSHHPRSSEKRFMYGSYTEHYVRWAYSCFGLHFRSRATKSEQERVALEMLYWNLFNKTVEGKPAH